MWIGAGAVVCLIGFHSFMELPKVFSYKNKNISASLPTQETRSLATVDSCNPGTEDSLWSPCYSDTSTMNRDAQGARWCRNQGYDGVDPNGYVYCYLSLGYYYYKFKCAHTHSIDKSPCYRDEDAYKMGYKNSDDAGLHWCWGKGYDITDAYQYCGNSYYKFHQRKLAR